MTARTIAIGDIHGCLKALNCLVDAIELKPDDTLVTLGDVIDRGPDSRGVIERLIELQQRCRLIVLRGNHEQMLLDGLSGDMPLDFWLQCGGQATIAAYGDSIENVPLAHRRFLEQTVVTWECETHFFIHANYVADLPLADQPISVALWEHLTYMVPPRHISGKCAVVGHTPQRDGEVLDLDHLICLDTFCVGGGWLTAMEFPVKRTWQADLLGRLREDEDSNE